MPKKLIGYKCETKLRIATQAIVTHDNVVILNPEPRLLINFIHIFVLQRRNNRP